jgi:hypothetical protein
MLMTTTIWLRNSMALPLVLALATGCEVTTTEPGDDDGDGQADAGGDGDGDGDGDAGGDGDGDGDGDGGMPELCGVTDTICHGDTPVCVDGRCVECSPEDESLCSPTQFCNAATNRCDSKNTPFALDCSDLPSDGVCQGGPREVLLVAEETGLVLMFDPIDGHYLGRFKEAAHDRADGEQYWTATQGPDQCIWTTSRSAKGVQRWNTDGTFKDDVLPVGRYYAGQDDLISDPRGLAFTENEVYVTSTGAYDFLPPRVVKFDLTKLDAPPTTDDFEVVIDDGSRVDSLVVLGNGSMVVANQVTERVELLPSEGELVPLLAMLEEFGTMGQVSYAGAGDILSTASADGILYKINVDTQMGKEYTPAMSNEHVYGIAVLGNGNYLYAGDSVQVLFPESTQPVGAHERVFDDVAITDRDFRYIGRACLPEAFVEERSMPDAEATSCDEPAGAALLDEDFDEGDFTGSGAARNYNGFTERPWPEVTVEIDSSIAADGSVQSLKITGGSDPLSWIAPEPSGVAKELPHIKPSYVGYYLRWDGELSPEYWAYPGYLTLNTEPESVLEAIYTVDGVLSTNRTHTEVALPEKTWVRIQLRDIDWEARTYDLYVDCDRVADDVPFADNAGSDLFALELFNLRPTTDFPLTSAWYDEIVIK